MPTEQELQAELDKLKQELADNKRKIEVAASIQRAYNNLPAAERDYLQARADGREAAPPWGEAPKPEPEIDPDLDTAAALKAQEERLTAHFDAKLNQMASLLNQQVTAANTRAMSLESREAVSKAQQWFEQEYPGFDFEKYRAVAGNVPGAEALAGSPEGLQTLLRAAVAPDLVEHGRSQVKEEKTRINRMVNDIFGGPTPTGARGGDEDEFDDLDWETNPDRALEQAAERMSAHL